MVSKRVGVDVRTHAAGSVQDAAASPLFDPTRLYAAQLAVRLEQLAAHRPADHIPNQSRNQRRRLLLLACHPLANRKPVALREALRLAKVEQVGVLGEHNAQLGPRHLLQGVVHARKVS